MNRGEIWYVNLDPTIGSEINKTRPAVIINNNTLGKLPIKVIVPITEWKNHYKDVPWMVKIKPGGDNKLSKVSAADAFQIRAVSEKRLINRAGFVTPDIMELIVEAVATVISDI